MSNNSYRYFGGINMFFSSLSIANFRNFENVKLDLTNKNIIFGLNDIGKTNFLCAIRFLLDREFRKNGLVDTDFFNRKIDKEISITLKINIDGKEDDDNKKIYSYMKGAISSEVKEIYIQLIASYGNEALRAESELFWGSDINNLEAIPSNQSLYELDRLFNVVYIDSSIQLDNVFKRYTREMFRSNTSIDEKERTKLNRIINSLNNSVSNLHNIKEFEQELVEEYKNFRKEEEIDISIRSEIELNNLYSKLTPYICNENSDIYPTAGDGRGKILAYTLLTLENRRIEQKKINIFLIEELENHLHRSMQIALSYQIFSDDIFKYLFMTTHSSLIVSQMDNVNLIKLYKEKKIIAKSHCYKVPPEYIHLKQKLNQNLAEAIYADTVLLVEGPSEKILFERILKEKCEKYESFGGYILEVEGINFKEYYEVLKKLGIKIIIKTDNDLKLNKNKRECNLLGLNRGLSLIKSRKVPNIKSVDIDKFEKDTLYKKSIQADIYDAKYKHECENLEKKYIYLSRIDLENDLYEAIPDIMDNLVQQESKTKKAVDFLQEAKMINMIELCKILDKKYCNIIYNHKLFLCIKELVNSCCQ